MKAFHLAAAMIGVVLSFSSCLKSEKTKIAIMTKLEAGSIVGTSEINASKMYLDDNDIQNIEIVPFDDGWNPDKAKKAFARLEKQGIRILITSHVSTCALALEKEINRAKVLTFVTGATTDELSKKDDYVFRTVPDVADEQKSIAEYVNGTRTESVIIIRDTDNFGYTDPAVKYFKAHLKKPVAAQIDVSIGRLDPGRVSRSIPGGGNSMAYLLIGGYNVSAGSIAQIVNRVLPSATIMFSPWVKSPTLLETLGGAVNRSVIPSHYPPRKRSRAIDEYLSGFKKRFGYYPTFISINVYGALEIISAAIRAGKTGPEEIKRYILETKKFATKFGTVEFDRYGDVHRPLYFITDLTKEF